MKKKIQQQKTIVKQPENVSKQWIFHSNETSEIDVKV